MCASFWLKRLPLSLWLVIYFLPSHALRLQSKPWLPLQMGAVVKMQTKSNGFRPSHYIAHSRCRASPWEPNITYYYASLCSLSLNCMKEVTLPNCLSLYIYTGCFFFFRPYIFHKNLVTVRLLSFSHRLKYFPTAKMMSVQWINKTSLINLLINYLKAGVYITKV